jgi:regulator of cell morphogenesis and NO signaling
MTMTITPDTRISDIAVADPGTIRVFQHHHIDFCCGGKIPLAEACQLHGIDPESLVAELNAVGRPVEDATGWQTLGSLVAHIQERYHEPLRAELPRLATMMAKVVQRHGDRLPETLLPLRDAFEELTSELIPHMAKEDAVLFPAILAAEASVREGHQNANAWQWIEQPIDVMEAEHDAAGAALARMRELTDDYTPPADACPTFRGLYHGLAELERDMHVHVHLENNILFPRAAQLIERQP